MRQGSRGLDLRCTILKAQCPFMLHLVYILDRAPLDIVFKCITKHTFYLIVPILLHISRAFLSLAKKADHGCPTQLTPAHLESHPAPTTTRETKDPKQDNHLLNAPAPNVPFYTPIQPIPAGTSIIHKDASSSSLPLLFQPLQLRSLTLQNRIVVSPMCEYSAIDGHFTDWHLVHLGGIISRGSGLTILEATAVTPEGRITPQDTGLWKDSQIAPLKHIVHFAHSQGQHVAIQLSHAGRKASTVAPWIDRKAAATKEVGGWPDEVLGTSPEPYDGNACVPRTMTLEDIERFKQSFVAAIKGAPKVSCICPG